MEFVKKGELKIKGNGYLVNKKEEPVSHAGFVAAQEKAHYLVKLSKAVEGKNFEGKKADSFEAIVTEVVNAIKNESTVKYAADVKEPNMKLRDQLAEEALNWVKFEEDKDLNDKINSAMQQFNVIKDFEEFGLFFSKDIVKIPAIYTIDQILAAVKVVEPLLNKNK